MAMIPVIRFMLLAAFLAVFGGAAYKGETYRPNIIFIMADDLGNAFLGYRGSDIKTPNIFNLE